MMMPTLIQYVSSFLILIFSTLATWYEGSEIRNQPWEWDYSAIFSKIINGTVKTEVDISSLDHFVYAAKFKPIYPIIMVITILYILTLTASKLLGYQTNKMVIYYGGLGICLLLISSLIYSSPTRGLKLFTWLFITSGLLSIITSIILKFNLMRTRSHLL